MSDRRGFTLVEVVLSLALSAMVIVMLFASLRLGHRAAAKGDSRAEVAQRVMVLSDRLSWLIAGAYPYRHFDEDKGKVQIIFSGENVSMGFVTTSVDDYSGDIVDRAGLKYVNLHLESDGLNVSEKIFFMGEGEQKAYVLEPNVTSLEFAYMDEGSGDWTDNWDTESSDYLPVAVKVILRMNLDDKEIILPPVMGDSCSTN